MDVFGQLFEGKKFSEIRNQVRDLEDQAAYISGVPVYMMGVDPAMSQQKPDMFKRHANGTVEDMNHKPQSQAEQDSDLHRMGRMYSPEKQTLSDRINYSGDVEDAQIVD